MAGVPYSGVPEVSAETQAPNDRQQIEASPAAFGAQVSQAAEGAGEKVLQLSDFYGKVAADEGVNNFLEGSQKLLYGDLSQPVVGDDGQPIKGPDGSPVGTGGFYSLRGADALKAAPQIEKQLNDLIAKQRQTLTTPESQQQFETESRRYRAQALERMSSFADQQYKNWGVSTADNSIALTQNGIATHLGDDSALAADKEAMRRAYVQKDSLLFGHSPDVANAAVLKADQDWALTQIRSAIGNNDPMRAQKAFDDNKGVLGSLSNYDTIARTVKGAVIDATMSPAIDRAVDDAMAAAGRSVSAAPSQDYSQTPFAQVKANIIAHEAPQSLGGYNALAYNTSAQHNSAGVPQQNLTGMTIGQVVDFQNNVMRPATAGRRGAGDVGSTGVGAYQFESGTLQQQAKAVFGDKWRDMKFTPETQDVLAEHLFNQVKGNPGQLGSTWAAFSGTQHYPSVTDALNANMTSTLDKAQADAERLFPNYPDAQERYVQGVRRHLDQAISQQHQQYEVDTHIVQSVMAGDNPPISEQQLMATSPQVAAAWRSMQINNPYGAMSVERMFDANAKGRAAGYGTDFKSYLDRVLAPSDSQDRITDPSQLWRFVGTGDKAGLTNSGVNQLSTLLQGRGTPAGDAQAAQIRQFVDQAHATLTFTNRGTGVYDAKGEQKFAQYMASVLPTVVNAQKSGNLGALLDPKSKDYIGGTIQTFMRTPDQLMKDRLQGQMGAQPLPQYTRETLTRTLEGLDNDEQRKEALKAAVAQNRISRADATAIAAQRGYIRGAPAVGGVPFVDARVDTGAQ